MTGFGKSCWCRHELVAMTIDTHSTRPGRKSLNKGPAETVTENPVLLIVDDDEGVRAALRVVFVSDYQLLIAESGEQGIGFLKHQRADVAIVDLRMPKMSGIQVLENIKRIDPFVEVIILTGLGTAESSRQAISAGAFAYLTKPFGMKECRETVANALDRRRRRRF